MVLCRIVCRHQEEEHQELIYQKLPSDIHETHVLLMDPMLSTGNTACKAIKVGLCTLQHVCAVQRAKQSKSGCAHATQRE